MMKILIAAAVIMSPAPLLAASGEPGDQGASSEQNQTRNPRICRQVTARSSASRMGPRRVCRTASQWRALDEGTANDDIEAMQPMLHENRPVAATPG